MATFGDIIAAGDTVPHTIADNTGIFAAFTTMNGVKTTYLLRGELDDYNAEISGRVEQHGETVKAYRGNGLTGGVESTADGTKFSN